MNRRKALATLLALPAVHSIAVADVHPDDVIVVECDHPMSQSACEHIKTQLAGVWPGRKVLVLDGSVRLRIVREQELQTEAHG